ncbi:Sodium-dependent glucose transporter 1 [Mizuhopecten yessoensis]|uniref:Sodium-dependent glucose transporter 1 n=1 Tax=Mizuhopecten yessoensis TaxID=6573 RepID=A0A210PWI5_MIZYE|nr:Sodium-dependent glucose transporter 1 [Mizuhopecten yessoensis]
MTKERNGSNINCSHEHETISQHDIDKEDIEEEIHSKIVHIHEQQSLISELRHDEVIRFKVTLSMCVTFVYVMLGWCKSQTGPAFLDILYISGTDLEKGSAFMTSYSAGCAIGSVVGGSFYSKVNRYLLLVVALTIYSLTRALIPWCILYELMITVNLIHGVCAGVITVVVVAVAVSIWGATPRGRVFLNIFLVSDGGAGLIAPMVLTPFLLPPRTSDIILGNDPRNFSIINVATRNTSTIEGNISAAYSILQANISHIEIPASSVYIAYSISAGLVFLSTLPFIVIFAKPSKNDSKGSVDKESNFLGKLPLRVKRLQLVNVGIFSTFYMAVFFIFTGYLPAFCVEHLRWTKTSGAWLMSVVYFAMLCGRLFGAFLSNFFKPMKMLLLSTILHVMGLVGLSVSGVFLADVGIWISVCGVGIAWGFTWPSLLNWTNENLIPVRGLLLSLRTRMHSQ